MKLPLIVSRTGAALALFGIHHASAHPRELPPPQQDAERPAHNLNPTLPPPPRGRFGDPLSRLTIGQLAAFATGSEEFSNVETPESGLGPLFNNTSCAACHTTPVIGGSSALFVTRFGRMHHGVFDPMADQGGSLLQQFAIDPAVQEFIPREANVVARRITTPLFGLGLIEAIPDDAIRANERRPQPDGIHGRVAIVTDVTTQTNRVGRFGWKAQQATLLAFAADAYVNEMGITSRFFPTENAPNGNTGLLAVFDPIADPEDVLNPVTDKSDIDAAADFIRYLAPPPPLPLNRSSAVGQRIFADIGCAGCHLPTQQTGHSEVAALRNQPVNLYSDLLLHDMGRLADGIGQAAAGPREMKTAPLWGLRARPVFLHDGRAPTPDAAILGHDGEAARSRDRYRQLNPVQRQQLLDFLNSI